MIHGLHKRTKYNHNIESLEQAIREINSRLMNHNALEAIDIIEQVALLAPQISTKLLAQAYDIMQSLPDKDTRYTLYQSRYFDFPVKEGDKVLDIGSGHLPYPMATHLADLAVEDHNFGRAGIPFKHVQGKPVFNCGVEDMPFEDKSFDFVYCSHVLEHVNDPIKACKELMRVAKRGYLETPTRAKDLFLNTAKISNHHWKVEFFNERLVFTEYTKEELEGLSSDILMSMHCNPETEREKAFSALVLLKSDQVNTMLMWEGGFNVEVRRIGKETEFYNYQANQDINNKSNNSLDVTNSVIISDNPTEGAIRLYC
jgi:ubiquinone/menaquinone biosynthesis C-methylase UbiE